MASLSQSDKQEIHDQLVRASTWVNGPRRTKLEEIAKRVLGEEESESAGSDADGPE